MKSKTLLIILTILFTQLSFGQIIDIDYSHLKPELEEFQVEDESNIESLGRSFIDFFGNGNMQGTAQLIKIKIGEPGKFSIPFYFFLGASGDGFSKSEKNENTVANLLNPIGGILNGSFKGNFNLVASDRNITSLKGCFQVAGKLINADEIETDDSQLIVSGYANAGLMFQTGAWADDDEKNLGVFWAQITATSSYGISEENLNKLFGENSIESNIFLGYSFDMGIEIQNRINLKFGVYQYFNNQEIDLFSDPIIKLSLDYDLKKG